MFCMVGERCPENKTLLRNTTDSDWSAGCFIMEQKKKVHTGLLSIFLGIILCLSMLPATVFAEVGAQTQNEEVGTLSEQNLIQTQDEGQTVAPSDSSDSSAAQQNESSSPSDSSAAQAQDEGVATKPTTSSDQNNPSSVTSGNSSEQDAVLEANSIVTAEGAVATVTLENGAPSSYATIEEAFTAANAAGKATITLLDNCTVTDTTSLQINTGSDITLDLAGHTLTGNGQTSVITVNTNSTFTLDGSGTITGGFADNGGGVYVAGTFTMNNGTIAGNTAEQGGGVYVASGRFIMQGGIISRNNAHDGGGVYASRSITLNRGSITENTATGNGGGVWSSPSFLYLAGISITKNHAAGIGGGIVTDDMMVAGTPQIVENTAGAAHIRENVAVAPLKRGLRPLITVTTWLSPGANIGITAYNSLNEDGTYELARPWPNAGASFAFVSDPDDNPADAIQYFFSDKEGYTIGLEGGLEGRSLALFPLQYTVTLHPQGGTFEDGTTEAKTITVTYGQSYGFRQIDDELPTVTKQDTHFAAWSLSESDAGQHLHIGKDSLVDISSDHDLYAHWQEKPLPEISFEFQEYIYDGTEHPFDFTIDKGPQDNGWKIYYFEHTGDFHERPTDESQFSTTPPINADDYCIVVVHEEVIGTDPDNSWAYFESELIHNGVKITPATITLTGDVSKMYDGSAEIPITADDITLPENSIYDRDKGKVELVVADDANLTLHSSDAGTTGVGKLKGVYLTGDAAKNYQIEYAVTGTITENTNEYTLTFETNGGSVLDPVTKRYGSVVDLTSYTPTKEGYSFTGWYADEALTGKIDSVTLTSDMTVYAGWTEEEPLAPGTDRGTDPAKGDANSSNNPSDNSDKGSTLPLTGSALQLGLLLLALCALAAALITPLVVKRKRKKLDF